MSTINPSNSREEQPMPSNDAYVYKETFGFKVHPGVLVRPHGHDVTFVNLAEDTADFTFPQGLMQPDSNPTAPPNGGTKTFHITDEARGLYKYKIKVGHGFLSSVRGGSAPKMIIDP
jgi:hypothetical protein